MLRYVATCWMMQTDGSGRPVLTKGKHNMLPVFGHPVAICCDMRDDVGSNLKAVKVFVQHFGRCMMLYSFGHVHATLLH